MEKSSCLSEFCGCFLCLLENCNFLRILASGLFTFLRMTVSTAVARLSHHNSVCPSVCLTGGSVKNGLSYDYQIFTIGCPEDSSFRKP